MTSSPALVGPSRYETLLKIASGGMATVYVGHPAGVFDPGRLVAIKRPHPHLVEEESFRRSLFAEANLAARILHENVVSVRDVEVQDESMHLVMDYVEGISLAELLSQAVSSIAHEELAAVGMRVLLDACAGLQAAHELRDDHGRELGLVHRDVSPHNILVGLDGTSRVVDFGIAKCMHLRDGLSTTTGTVKGKTAYMAPEYINGRTIDRRSDIFAMGILFWEVLALRRLFRGQNDGETLARVMSHTPERISSMAPFCGTRFDTVVGRALAKAPSFRHRTMFELAQELSAAASGTTLIARHEDVGWMVERVAGERLASRRERVLEMLTREAKKHAEEDDEGLAGATMPLVVNNDAGVIERYVPPHDTGPPPPAAFAATFPLGGLTPNRAATLPLGAISPARPASSASLPSSPASAPSVPNVTVSELTVAGRKRSSAPFVLGVLAALFLAGFVVTLLVRRSEPVAAATETKPTASVTASASPTAPDPPAATSIAAETAPAPTTSASSAPRAHRLRPRPTASTSAVAAPTTAAPSPPPPDSAETPRPLPTNPYHR